MSWNIFDAVGVVLDIISLFSSSSEKEETEEKDSKQIILRLSSFVFTLVGLFLLFITFKSPSVVDNSMQKMVILFLIGVVFSFIICFILFHLNLFHFKNLSSMVYFCFSLIFVSITSVTYFYFKAGLF